MEVQKHFSSIVLCKTSQFLQYHTRLKKSAKFFKFIENWFKLFWFSCSKRAGWSSTDAETIVNSNIKSLPQLQYHVLLTRTNFSTFSSIRSEGTVFIPFYHFHLLTNIHIFICSFGFEMTRVPRVFNGSVCNYLAVTRWDLLNLLELH